MMDSNLCGLELAHVYIEHVVVFSNTLEEEVSHAEQVLETVAALDFKLKIM